MIRRLMRVTPRIYRQISIRFSFCQNKYSDEVLSQLKQNAQQFYNDIVVEDQSSVEVKDTNHFNSVIQESNEKLILIYCYAKWSKECQQFEQQVNQLSEKHSPLIKQLRIDVDKHSQIVTELQIRSIPFAGLVYQYQMVDFYQKGGDFQKFTEMIEKLIIHLKGGDTDQIVFEELNNLINTQQFKELVEATKKLLITDSYKKYYGKFLLYQIYAYINLQDLNQAQELTQKFNKSYQDELSDVDINEFYNNIIKEIEELKNKQKETPQLIQLLERLDLDPSNKELRMEISEYCINEKLFEQAIKQLLDLIKIDRNWQDRRAQKRLLELFVQLGSSNSLVVEGRKSLAKILY